jgi:hypothetical protein
MQVLAETVAGAAGPPDHLPSFDKLPILNVVIGKMAVNCEVGVIMLDIDMFSEAGCGAIVMNICDSRSSRDYLFSDYKIV